MVPLFIYEALGEREFQTKSDVNGNYSFRDLPSGKFTIWADLPPNLVLGELILDVPVPFLEVAAGACGEYQIKALPTGRISGQVLAKGGTGVSGWDASDIQLFRADSTRRMRGLGTIEAGGIFRKMADTFEFKHVGIHVGRPRLLKLVDAAKILELRESGLGWREIAAELKVSVGTLYNKLRVS